MVPIIRTMIPTFIPPGISSPLNFRPIYPTTYPRIIPPNLFLWPQPSLSQQMNNNSIFPVVQADTLASSLTFLSFTLYVQFISKSHGLYLQNTFRICLLFTTSMVTTLIWALTISWLNYYSSMLTDFPASKLANLQSNLNTHQSDLSRTSQMTPLLRSESSSGSTSLSEWKAKVFTMSWEVPQELDPHYLDDLISFSILITTFFPHQISLMQFGTYLY